MFQTQISQRLSDEKKVETVKFGDLSLDEEIFENMLDSYTEFPKWFKKNQEKRDECGILRDENNKVIGIISVKADSIYKTYIEPDFCKMVKNFILLKIRTFRSLNEREGNGKLLLDYAFEIAKRVSLEDIYITFYNNKHYSESIKNFLLKHGFNHYGIKTTTGETVYYKKINSLGDKNEIRN